MGFWEQCVVDLFVSLGATERLFKISRSVRYISNPLALAVYRRRQLPLIIYTGDNSVLDGYSDQ